MYTTAGAASNIMLEELNNYYFYSRMEYHRSRKHKDVRTVRTPQQLQPQSHIFEQRELYTV